MMKPILVSSLILMATLSDAWIAQAQTPLPSKPTPAPTTPATPPQATPSTEVSPEELQKFARIAKQVLAVTKDAETQIIRAIRKAGFTEAQFDEIYQVQSDPTVQPAKPLSAKDKERYDQAIAQIRQIQQATQTQVETVMKTEGMDLQRFNQILAIVQNDPKLLQEVQRLMKG
jgi:DNA-binding transcriptional MerR regulator